MNQQLRERFYDMYHTFIPKEKVLSFIISEIETVDNEAEQRWIQKGREEMRKECLECIPPDSTIEFGKDEEYQRWHSEWTDARNHTIRTAISSLK